MTNTILVIILVSLVIFLLWTFASIILTLIKYKSMEKFMKEYNKSIVDFYEKAEAERNKEKS